jgi:uncharacterized protein YeaO (DUF488 family)
MATPKVLVKRIYDKPEFSDGIRVLVDRLWPRGVRRSTANVDVWLSDIGPSDELRKWFAHDPKKWKGFKKKYLKELKVNEALEELVDMAFTHGTITLLFATRDEKHNNATVLGGVLQRAIKKAAKKPRPVVNRPPIRARSRIGVGLYQ